MARIFLTGANQRPHNLVEIDEWHQYAEARLVELDTDTGQARVVFRWTSPPEHRPAERPSHVFKAGSWDGDRLLLCTNTEVLRVDPRTFTVERVWSHPWFNDLHHVARVGGALHVVSTGLEAVVVLSEAGEATAIHSVTGRSVWRRFDRDTDYRRIHTTRPHEAHANYVFEVGDDVWVTRCLLGDALRVGEGEGRMRLREGVAPIHDGRPRSDGVWFTSVDGKLHRVHEGGVETHDLNVTRERGGVGWCRGLHLEGDVAYVGLSRLRRTKLRRSLGWLARRIRNEPERWTVPTCVMAYDVKKRASLGHWVIEDLGVHSVYGILPAEPPLA